MHYYLPPRQGPTYVLDKSALPVPQTGSYARRDLQGRTFMKDYSIDIALGKENLR